MNYHDIEHDSQMNGAGLRVVLFVSGCSHRCPGCQNAETWDSKSGIEFDAAAREEIFNALENDWIQGLTLSGGDPLFKGNRKEILGLVTEVKERFPHKNIWLYTGYTWEELRSDESEDLSLILAATDVLVDGKFDLELASAAYPWAGSTNQRVIDVFKSLKSMDLYLLDSCENL